ncbi:MAG: hypothetical protein HC888_00895 [Candidatus Competibacteraceae bacterium]|nr:hypothetical protein [Candidatus Competibacteraceae bacterium]
MGPTKYDDMPLEELMAARERARQDKNEKVDSALTRIITEHPQNLIDGYHKAKGAGDYGNARKIHGMYRQKRKPKSDADLYADPIWVQDAKEFYKAEEGQDFTGSDEEAARWALGRMGQFNFNTAQMAVDAISSKTGKWGDDGSRAFLGLLERTDDLPNFTAEGTKRLLKGVATDPTTYLGGMGLGRLVFGKGSKAASEMAIRSTLRKGLDAAVKDEFVEAGAKGLMKQGVTSTTGKAVVQSTGVGAAGGTAYGVGDSTARQSIEQGAGSGEGYDLGRMAVSGVAGAAFGGGLGTGVGAIAARGNTGAIRRTRGAIHDYSLAGDGRTSAALQRNAIDSAGTEAQQLAARQMFESGDVRGLDELYGQVRKANRVQMATPEFNAGVVKGINTEASKMGTKALERLRMLGREGKVDGYTVTRAEAAFQAAKAPNSHHRASDFKAMMGEVNDPEALQALSMLASEATSAAQTVPYRTIRGQQSRLREFLENPLVKAAADMSLPGGSTGTTIGGKLFEMGARKMGIMAPTPTKMLSGRADAMAAKVPKELIKAFERDTKKIGQEIVDHIQRAKAVTAYRQKAPRANGGPARPAWSPEAGKRAVEPTTNLDGLATAALEVGMPVPEYAKTVQEMVQFFKANGERPEVEFYASEFMQNRTLRERDFYKFQNTMEQFLVQSGKRTPEQIKEAKGNAQKTRKKGKLVERILAERQMVELKVSLGEPLTTTEARKAVIYKAQQMRDIAMDAIATSPDIPNNLKGKLRMEVEHIANKLKTPTDKEDHAMKVALALEQKGFQDAAIEFLQIVEPITHFGKKK